MREDVALTSSLYSFLGAGHDIVDQWPIVLAETCKTLYLRPQKSHAQALRAPPRNQTRI